MWLREKVVIRIWYQANAQSRNTSRTATRRHHETKSKKVTQTRRVGTNSGTGAGWTKPGKTTDSRQLPDVEKGRVPFFARF